MEQDNLRRFTKCLPLLSPPDGVVGSHLPDPLTGVKRNVYRVRLVMTILLIGRRILRVRYKYVRGTDRDSGAHRLWRQRRIVIVNSNIVLTASLPVVLLLIPIPHAFVPGKDEGHRHADWSSAARDLTVEQVNEVIEDPMLFGASEGNARRALQSRRPGSPRRRCFRDIRIRYTCFHEVSGRRSTAGFHV